MSLLEKLGLASRVLAGVGNGGAAMAAPPPVGAAAARPNGDAAGQGGDDRDARVATKLIAALAPKYDEGIARAQSLIDAQPVPTLKKMLEGEIAALRASRQEIDKMDPVPGAKRMGLVSSQAPTLRGLERSPQLTKFPWLVPAAWLVPKAWVAPAAWLIVAPGHPRPPETIPTGRSRSHK